ncbi:hypothetical protein EK21DRAFT_65284 [Setomelanomma holmii]|uniref:Uncharacterized protein n=1 Tax=Setomelanomma holmii TaxID=210430 RepID=A0A9P4LKL9_9PLEO|nr:hypothetical protein EK21DRAFT_65284 [Setomelanomma holmii]
MNMPTRLRSGPPPPLPPRKPQYLLGVQGQTQAQLIHGARQAKYNCSCGDNDKANVCSCSSCHSILRNDNSPCNYLGRCAEPLAWNIENELVRNQVHCPLFLTLPKELREIIFAYALTDCKSHSLETLALRNPGRLRIRPNRISTNDIAVNLLRTCRAVYLETWTLPLSLNPYIIYDLHAPNRLGVQLDNLLPWQLALIQSLDITLQQVALEGTMLYDHLHHRSNWQPEERHKGVYIVPRRYKTHRGPRAMVEIPASFNFSMLPAEPHENRHFLSHVLGKHPRHPPDLPPPWSSAMRVMRARPLTQLTLRILHGDWWTWTDDPNSTDEHQHLGLDPTVGDGRAHVNHRPTAPRMRALVETRRAGHHPDASPGQGWQNTIGELPDLRRLELVLETFSQKRQQLDNIIEAAKAWKFPIKCTQYELVWDGEVGMSSWSVSTAGGDGIVPRVPGMVAPAWHTRANEFQVRVIRYVRRRAA